MSTSLDNLSIIYLCCCLFCSHSECTDINIDMLSEDKARKILERIELLSKIREDILTHVMLDERLKLCQPSADLPEWWQLGKHDKDLLIGAAR